LWVEYRVILITRLYIENGGSFKVDFTPEI